MKSPRLIFSLFLFIILTSCNTPDKNTREDETPAPTLDDIIRAAGAISPEIENFGDVFNMLKMVEADYYPILCNDPYHAARYINDPMAAAANLGVYVTDIIYHTHGNASRETFLTFNAAQELSRSLGLDSEFGATLLTELEGNRISRDSLILAFNDLLEDSRKYASSEDLIHLHTAFLSGLLIEKLYITGSLLKQVMNREDKSRYEIINGKELLVIYRNQLKGTGALREAVTGQHAAMQSLFDISRLAEIEEKTAALEGDLQEMLESALTGPDERITDLHHLVSILRDQIVSAG